MLIKWKADILEPELTEDVKLKTKETADARFLLSQRRRKPP